MAVVGGPVWQHDIQDCYCDLTVEDGYIGEKCSEIYLAALNEQSMRFAALEELMKEQYTAGFEAGTAEVWASLM